jgi:hypothetical protein
MSVFQANAEEKQSFERFTGELTALTDRLRDAASEDDIRKLTRLRENFDRKTADFFRENRKLNIGVMGQVKAGKSSFLNTLLFDGAAVLPKASTPKTATLTKMEYGEENAICIEYYSREDWDAMQRNAAVDAEDEIFASARELVEMARRSGIDAEDCIARGAEELRFGSHEELAARLNDYVGENGRYTPLVKSVTLRISKEEFRELSIVDTPGLNDPIVSRTLRTKEFMELCDVVFFLSQSGGFLDKSDWELLSAQLPQKGVKRLSLVASKCDSALRDVLRKAGPDDDIFGGDPNTADNLPAARALIEKKLRSRARSKVDEFVRELRGRDRPETLIRVVEECREPLIVSAMAHNMANKPEGDYDDEERNVYAALSRFSDDLRAELPRVGNIEAVRAVYSAVVAEKERILAEKAAGFVPAARAELRGLLEASFEKARRVRAALTEGDRAELLKQKEELGKQINGIKADIKESIGEWNARIEAKRSETRQELRTATQKYQSIEERAKTVTKWDSYEEPAGGILGFLDFLGLFSKTVSYSYEETTRYLVAADAVDNIRSFVLDGESEIEKLFTDAINTREMRRKLLDVVTKNFDMSDEKYDAALFRLTVEETINRIEFPAVGVDCSAAVNQIASRFSGEVTDSAGKEQLREALSNAVAQAFEALGSQMERSVSAFKKSLNDIGDSLQGDLLESINAEFDDIAARFQNKEKELEKLDRRIGLLEKELEGMRA